MRMGWSLTAEQWKWLKLTAYGGLWLLFSFIPMVALGALLAGPRGLLLLSVGWKALVAIWVVSFVTLFVWIGGLALQHPSGGTIQWKLGVLCTFAFGLPAILITAVPLVPVNVKSLQQRFPHGNIVDLRHDPPPKPREDDRERTGIAREPNVYVIGVDVSSGLVPLDPQATEGEVPRAETAVDLVASTIVDLFGENGLLGQRWQRNDILAIWIFGGGEVRTLLATNEGSPWEKERILQRLRQGALAAHVSELPAGPSAAGTNILGFLDTALNELPSSYRQAKVILFSDVRQVEVFETCESPATRRDKIESGIVRVAQRIDKSPRLTVIAIRPGNPPLLRDDMIVKDVAVRFNGLLTPDHWQSDDLRRFQSRTRTEKQMQLLGLFEEVLNPGTIYLKYETSSGNRSVPSFLLLNEKTPRMTVALRKRDSIRTDAQTPSNMRVTVGEGSSYCSIELESAENGASDLSLLNDVGTSVPVRLDAGAGLRGEPRADLLVAMSPTRIYRIPISLLEVESGEAEASAFLYAVLLALNSLSFVFAFQSIRFVRRNLPDL